MTIHDTQGSLDTRNIGIDRVGIKDLRYPLQVQQHQETVQNTVGHWTMTVNLPSDKKGTHMSRFVEILHQQSTPINYQTFEQLLQQTRERLHADNAYISVKFPYFIEKQAPVSKTKSYLDYEVCLEGNITQDSLQLLLQVMIPVKSLCPCSKAISEQGAHNQRSHLTLQIELQDNQLWIEDLVHIAEQQASVDLYALLKRADEKYVTEYAYHNPKFVEDVVRDIALVLKADPRIQYYKITAENFESIHNHSAYAVIENY